jgi:hypothetical protein
MPLNLYQTLQLRLTIANDLQLLKGAVKDDSGGITKMQLRCHTTPILNAHYKIKQKAKLQNKRKGHWLNAPGLAWITTMLATSSLWTSEHPLDLLRLNFRFRIRMIYPHMHKYEMRLKYTMYEVQMQYNARTEAFYSY